jgi:hypothetical protein
MAKKIEPRSPHPKIVLGLPDIQKQLLLVRRLANQAGDIERDPLENLGVLLSELYAQLQHKKQVTVYRYGSRTRSLDD